MWFLVILAVIAVLIIVLFVRAMRFKPAEIQKVDLPEEKINEGEVADHLARMIRCKTVSYTDKTLEDDQQFVDLMALLPKLYPSVWSSCSINQPSDRSLILHWKGRSADAPTVLMAHYDVVPVEEALWSKPAFDGIIEDGVLWGRGTLDTKTTFLGILEAAEALLKEGFVPENDIYMAFAGDEEINGHGAPANVKWLEEHHVHPALVLDEGGAVVTRVFPGVNTPCAVVGIAEKGPMNILMTVQGNGGHASTPPVHSSIGILAKAVQRIEKHPFPFKITPAAAYMFDTMGRSSSMLYRLIFGNLWLFKPVLNLICRTSGGELNALVRTTVALTRMNGSKAFNVIPATASIGANLRIMSGETTESALAYLKKVIHDDRVKISMVDGMNPSAVSVIGDEPWERLCNAIRGTWTDAMVSPYLMLACSDSRHYCSISEHVYRFSAMALTKEERGMIHGNNERIPLKTLTTTVAFFRRMMRSC